MDVIVFLLLACGAIGAWAGWSLGTRLFYGHSYDVFHPPGARPWKVASAIVFALVGVVFGFATLASMGAYLG